jgi:hypothetical protein
MVFPLQALSKVAEFISVGQDDNSLEPPAAAFLHIFQLAAGWFI